MNWVNAQPRSEPVFCLGDGHNGKCNLFAQIGSPTQRYEILDWYHLMENLIGVGGSLKRISRVEAMLWKGDVDTALKEFEKCKTKRAVNFGAYIQKHRQRIPNYGYLQAEGFTIGSGAVESAIKQIGRRVKISGALRGCQVCSSSPQTSLCLSQWLFLQPFESKTSLSINTHAKLRCSRSGLAWGGAMALVFSGIGGIWLTQQVLKPIKHSFQRLRQFTADASHELRSPLTAINTATEVMQSHPERIHPLDAKKLVAIASATDQLTHLAEDLLFLARSDAVVSPLSFQQKSFSLDKVLQDLVNSLEPQARVKGITFTFHLLTGIFVNGDATQLTRLFSNLLDNAFKYTAAGGNVALGMAIYQQFVVVRVEDTGMGIAPEYLPLVFQRFWRSDRARSRRVEGSGLGLAIAQAIVQDHRGKITVSSQIGVGSCFKVYLPII